MASHRTGATMPSEKFSARLSMAAREMPAASSAAVSRPTMCDTATRAAVMSPLPSVTATSRHVPMQAALRDQCAGKQGRGQDAGGPAEQFALHEESNSADDGDEDRDRGDACGPPRVCCQRSRD